MIDLLRGLAIFVVLILHYGVVLSVGPPRYLTMEAMGKLSLNGYYGVSTFFVISGYIITMTTLKRYGDFGSISILDFYKNRFARIAPGMALFLGVALALFYLSVPGFNPISPLPLGRVLLAVFTLRVNTVLEGLAPTWFVLWSLAIEEVFYLSYPIVFKALRRPIFLAALLAAVVVAGPLVRLECGYGSVYFGTGCFDQLALGCLTAIMVSEVGVCSPAMATALCATGATIWAMCYLGSSISYDYVCGPTIIALASAVILAGSAGMRQVVKGAVRGTLARMGPLSYEIYLFHMIIFISIGHLVAFGKVSHTYGSDVLFLPAVLVVFLVSKLVSRRLLQPVCDRIRAW